MRESCKNFLNILFMLPQARIYHFPARLIGLIRIFRNTFRTFQFQRIKEISPPFYHAFYLPICVDKTSVITDRDVRSAI